MDTKQLFMSKPARFKNPDKVKEMFISCGFNVDVENGDNLVIYSDYYNLYDYVAVVKDEEVVDFFLEDDTEIDGLKTVSLHEAIQMLLAPEEIFSATTVGVSDDGADGEAVIIVEGGEITVISLYNEVQKKVFLAEMDRLRRRLANPKLAYIVDNREAIYGNSYQYEVKYNNDNNIVLTSMTDGTSEKYCLAEIYKMNPEFFNENEI